jgi:hypothetical protein
MVFMKQFSCCFCRVYICCPHISTNIVDTWSSGSHLNCELWIGEHINKKCVCTFRYMLINVYRGLWMLVNVHDGLWMHVTCAYIHARILFYKTMVIVLLHSWFQSGAMSGQGEDFSWWFIILTVWLSAIDLLAGETYAVRSCRQEKFPVGQLSGKLSHSCWAIPVGLFLMAGRQE